MRRAWGWAAADFRKGLAVHDPSKLMIAPILFFGLMVVLDRAVYEISRQLDPNIPERFTRL